MDRSAGLLLACLGGLLVLPDDLPASPSRSHEWSESEVEVDVVGDPNEHRFPWKALQDTIWIADWSFDPGAPCDDTGWTHVDNHILFKGDVYWHLETGFSTSTGMTGSSFAVGYHDNACCENVDGYDNDWYQGIRITYLGAATLSFDYLVDSEAGYDYLRIESDSACASHDRVDFDVDPSGSAAAFRRREAQIDGLILNGEFVNQSLSDYGPGTHCVYIAFFSDGGYSPCDGIQPTSIHEGAVIDNIVITDDSGTRTEDFEDGTLDLGTAVDMADSSPFGTWARLFSHVTDNDICHENTTCSWLWTDDTTPSLFNDPSMAFGPGGYVIKNWLDDIIVGPWVSLASTPTATGTVISFRRFPGNPFGTSRIVHNWSVRGRRLQQGQTCVDAWGHAFQWNSLSLFSWTTVVQDMTYAFEPSSEAIQLRLRTSDWQWIIGADPPVPFVPGPGPYVDRVRIGRRILSGPVINEGIDSRSQAQDAFPSEIDPNIVPGYHYRPTTDRFGTCAFSQGTELGLNASYNVITGDSIWINVEAVRVGGDSVTSVDWHGAVVAGPHTGKAPPPFTVGANGFFSVEVDSVRYFSGGAFPDFYFVSLDDTYFRGGDQLLYFWSATDNGGGFTSDPIGMNALPASIEEAQEATQGLLEVSYLPTIDWDPAYVARIQADAHGDLEPTPAELAGSSQAHCILYVNTTVTRRRSGDVNRTSFMYTLDRLGYRGHYDVYDHQGFGNTNNQLASRATIEQAQGYNLIVYDGGNWSLYAPILPDGVLDREAGKVDQAGWFSAWLAQASLSEAGFATLWILGTNVVEGYSGQTGSAGNLLNTVMGVTLASSDQGLHVNPDVTGVANFTFDKGTGSTMVTFTNDTYVLAGGCPIMRNYDGADVSGASAVATHRYRSPITNQLGDAAVVMNRNNAEAYNTIMMTHPWYDIRDPDTPTSPSSATELLEKMLDGVLPLSCLQTQVTFTGGDDELEVPARTTLHQNVPNPFNPTTTIRFDLAREGHVVLRIYDVAGRLVRTLLDEERRAGADQQIVWNGLNEQDRHVSSGVYFYSLETTDLRLTRKMVVMK